MKPTLTFGTEIFTASPLGTAASVPDLNPDAKFQYAASPFPDEDDEIREGYGRLYASYPYRQYTGYRRTLENKEMATAVLENDYLKAVFLPGLGGRLWSLTDKRTGENLLYTNDVIRPGNLAFRNAWVSGGVEWNMGVIGHSPFTMEQIFTAEFEDERGLPILRMYEYERIRKATYQMDFWLEEHSTFLHCRMKVSNQTGRTIPMYWWSNMAAPEYEGGRVIAPAVDAYTNLGDGVRKVSAPFAGDTDVSFYQNIPNQIDYFFSIPEDAPKYIANLNKDGYGLLHMSTDAQKGRKLFSWGNNQGSDNWQDFLTENAGRYVEIQAGLAKTQYGCVPMAPHGEWEWLELYGPIHTSPTAASSPYKDAKAEIDAIVRLNFRELNPEQTLADTKALAEKKGKLLYSGSGYAAFENTIREFYKEPTLPGHLDFSAQPGSSALEEDYRKLAEFLKTGIFPEYPITDAPRDFLSDDALHNRLAETIETKNKNNWYAQYQLGLSFFIKGDARRAEECLFASNGIIENPWALHALAVLELQSGNEKQAASYITAGYAYRKHDLSYVKETWKILLLCHTYDTVISLYESLPEELQEESRIRFGYLQALSHAERETEVLDYLEHTDFVLDDLREGEKALSELWRSVYKKVYGKEGELPQRYNFNSL